MSHNVSKTKNNKSHLIDCNMQCLFINLKYYPHIFTLETSQLYQCGTKLLVQFNLTFNSSGLWIWPIDQYVKIEVIVLISNLSTEKIKCQFSYKKNYLHFNSIYWFILKKKVKNSIINQWEQLN